MNFSNARFARPLLLAALVGLLPGLGVAQTAYNEPGFTLPDPDGPVTNPTNVVYSKTVNAAIYPVINSVKVKLAVENPMQISLRVRLLNDRGEVLYSQKLPRKRKVDMHCFDMATMKDGSYVVEISDGVTRLPLEFKLESTRQTPVVVPERVIALN